jgi:hypothetical protein
MQGQTGITAMNEVRACPCLLRMLADDKVGTRAVCLTHKLFGRRERGGSVFASAEPMPQPIYAVAD